MSVKADKFEARGGKIFIGILCGAVYSSSSFQFPAQALYQMKKGKSIKKSINA
jgi:hypothetical protein